jgi:hypothetical protein
MSAEEYAPPLPPNVVLAVAHVLAGVTIESAAAQRMHNFELNEAPALPRLGSSNPPTNGTPLTCSPPTPAIHPTSCLVSYRLASR